MGRSVASVLLRTPVEPVGIARFGADIPRLVDHALAGRFDLDAMVSVERPLDDLPATLDALEAGQVLGRAVITLF